ncbi:MAG: hypothetical protein CFE26_22280, partial [Verrucomicrobiales bacterium VVV1]
FVLNTGMPAVVKSGGAIIDTNTFNNTIPTVLTHDSILGATADGGLTKLSTGTLTLSGLNTFTGDVTVSGGVLAAGVAGSAGNSALGSVGSTRTINVNSGGTLRFDVGNVFNNNFGNLTLTGGTLTATIGSASGYGSWNLNGTVTSTGSSFISTTASVPITLSAASGTNTLFDVQSGTLTATAALGQVTATGDTRVSSLTKTGSGTMILSGANTYSGG